MVYLGTTNPGKVREFVSRLSPLGIDVKTVSLEVREPFETLAENAWEKAHAYSRHVNDVVVVEDSGIFIDALGGLPGVWSARFSHFNENTRTEEPPQEGRTRESIDLMNNAKVLALLEGVPMALRGAEFRIHLIVADPIRTRFEVECSYRGFISGFPRGVNGFGYTPIFIGWDTDGQTLAELSHEEIYQRSHRRKALDAMLAWVEATPGALLSNPLGGDCHE